MRRTRRFTSGRDRGPRAILQTTCLIIAGAVFATALSACAKQTPEPAAPQGTFPAPASGPAEAELVKTLVLNKSDMAADYTEVPGGAVNGFVPHLGQPADYAAACKSLLDAGRGSPSITASFTSPAFIKNADTPFESVIASTAVLMSTAADAKDGLAIYKDGGVNNNLCLSRIFEPLWRKMIPGAGESGSGTDLALKVLPDVSTSHSAGLRLVGSVQSARQTNTASLDILVVVADRATSAVFITAGGGEPSEQVDKQLVQSLRTRLQSSLAASGTAPAAK